MSRAGPLAGTPLSTYRLQLRPGFGFDRAAEVAPYLARLGVSHLYASPYLQAAPGSTHGYDVVDPTRPNAELGGEEGHRQLCQSLATAGLGQVLDIVPNHMAITGPENAWWWDVLENGPSSIYASYFDVDWDPPEAKLRNTVLLPILADHYGKVLDAGEISIERSGGSFLVRYGDRVMPVAPRSLDSLLGRAASATGPTSLTAGVTPAMELESLAAAFGNLPPSWATDRASVRARHRDKEVLRGRLAALCSGHPEVAAAVDAEVARLNADPDCLDALLERQNYRLAYWRTAGQELDYRRFFDIDSLVGVRVEDEAVFEDGHSLVLSWLREGVVDGLRVDHIDGLRDPLGYLERLQAASGGRWVVVEKILGPEEELPGRWPVAGTTGYEFATGLTGLFMDPAGEEPFTALWTEVSGRPEPFGEVAHRAKHAVMRSALASDLARLTALFVSVCGSRRRYRDYTRAELAGALEEVLACLPVYRTYVGESGPAEPADVAVVASAVEQAAARRPDLDPELLGALRRVLLAEEPFTGTDETELRLRFQQVSGPVMAKGVEDTALYAYCRFPGLNEVGSDPGRWSTSPDAFHAAQARRAERWPASMVTTSTHDTKRSEDVRARLAVLSEMPGRWRRCWEDWASRNRAHREGGAVDRATEYLLYQTLVGAWPISAERAVAYMAKATREAKIHTSWTDPDPAYDQALERFVRAVLGDGEFCAEVDAFVTEHLLEAGWINSLSQALVKLTVPGVPDIYQGCELWDLSLVDPDNRRPVDFGLRQRLLSGLDRMGPEECWGRAGEGLPKLLVTHRALELRRLHPPWFLGGSYRPLPVRPGSSTSLVAFARAEAAITVVPRLVHGLGGSPAAVAASLRGTTVVLPGGRWRNVLTGDELGGDEVDAGRLLGRFPVALLAREA